MFCVLALEEVGDEDLISVRLVRVREDIGALQGLWREAEDVVND